MPDAVREIRRAVAGLVRQPGLSATVVLTLALAIGANTALFAYVCVFLWPTVDAPQPERLVNVGSPNENGWLDGLTHDDFRALEESREGFARVAGSSFFNGSVRPLDAGPNDDAGPYFAWAHAVSGDYFALYGARPWAGRLLRPDDDRPGAPRVAVIAYPFWRRHFGSDPGAVGRSIRIDGSAPYTIVGVAPEGFAGAGLAMQLYTPLAHWRDVSHGLDDPETASITVAGRLAPGVSAEAGTEALAAFGRGLDVAAPLSEPRRYEVERMAGPSAGWDSPEARRAQVLMSVVALFLLLAAVNVTNLLLARGLARRKDLAVRAALGAGRWRLARQVWLEGLVLALVGGLFGLFLGYVGALWLEELVRTVPVGFGSWGEGSTVIAFDGRMALFAFGGSLLTALLFTAAPVLEVLRRDVVGPLRSDSRGSLGGRSGPRRALVVAQVALAAALLVGAGLLVRSFREIGAVDLGFDTRGLFLATVYMPERPEDPDAEVRRFDELLERTRALPGVAAASLTMRPPLFGGSFVEGLSVEGGEERQLHTNLVSPGYFETLGVPMVRGRAFDERDRGRPAKAFEKDESDAAAQALGSVVVNETAAAKLWPGEEPLGRIVTIGSTSRPVDQGRRFQVIGVVADHRYGGPVVDIGSLVYFPLAQRPRKRPTVMIRTDGMPGRRVGDDLRAMLASSMPDLAVIELATLDDQLDRSLYEERLNTSVSSGVGLLGLAVAALGLGSLMAFSVGRRRREIAVRMAVGASPADATRLVLGQAGRLVAVGALAGAGLALALGQVLAGMLFGVSPRDPVTLAAVLTVLVAAALAATWIPARRAARVDPAAALRGE
jgi:putative ABC transport system permease protein